MSQISVVVDGLFAQGRGNLAVRLVADDGGDLPAFAAGDHVDVALPGGLTRPYSIASPPWQRDHYLLCVKREPQSRGGSAYVHEQLRVGQRLGISPPRSLFGLGEAEHHVLMAGGIGITPLLAMAHAIEHAGGSFELHHYVSHRGAAAFARELSKQFEGGRYVLHESDKGDSARLIQPLALLQPGAASRLYLCGPAAFMSHLQACARQAGWDPARIHQEAFAAPVEVMAGAVDDEAFEIELAPSGRLIHVAPNRTAAAALQEAGIAVALSCEMGICGACLTPVLDGEVDHRDTVQSEQEKRAAQQCMALCCSRGRTRRVRLQLG